MKKRIIIISMFCYCNVFSHSGRTDGDGGHYNRTTGEYHYHNGSGTLGKIIGGGFVLLLLLFASGQKNKK